MAKPSKVSQRKPPRSVKLADRQSKIIHLFQQGIALHQYGRLTEAQAIYEQILSIQADNFDALQLLGNLFGQANNYIQAVEFLSKAIKVDPNHAFCFIHLGTAFTALNRLDEALISYDKAISINPYYAEAYFNRGNVLDEIDRLEDALSSYENAIRIKADYAEAYSNRGLVLNKLNRLEDALSSYDKAIRIKMDYADAYSNRGNVLNSLGRLEDALSSYNNAISIKPDYAEAYVNRGNTLSLLKRLEEALSSYNNAISIKPDYAEPYYHRGNVLHDLKRLEEALSSYDNAISIKPDYAECYATRGAALQKLNRLEEALPNYQLAYQLKPEIDFLLGNLIHTKMHLCDWTDSMILVNQIREAILKQQAVTPPFVILALIDQPEIHKQCTSIYIDDQYPSNKTLPSILKYPKHQKIRIGYFSADFREHAVSLLTAELFESHDRDQFEIFAFSFGPNTRDKMRKRLEIGFDQFFDIQNKTDQEVVVLARQLEIDIAIDLGGLTAECRTGIFAMRAAPIQLSYIGYLGTMAAEYYDYLIADHTMIPQDHQQYYSEKIVYLPSYQVNDTKREVSKKIFTRAELGLPDNGFVFCCLNNIFKITPSTFDSWMRVLRAVEGSVLLLLDANETATNNLRKESANNGVDPNRLVFAKYLPPSEYLARFRVADLFLDTFPYNAGTTASDALRMGLPVLTLMGDSFASRMAASLLNAVGLPELITINQESYEALAIELAIDPQKLEAIKIKLVINLSNSPLFNAKLFTQHLEFAYQAIHQRYHEDLEPDHIEFIM